MNKSVWKKKPLPRYSAFKKGSGNKSGPKFDVVVVGGGISGLSAAYFLSKAGKKVLVLERGKIGYGDSGSTTAHLTAVTDLRLSELSKGFGDKNARLIWDAGDVAINAIEAIVNENKINCEFRRVPGYLHSSIEEKTPSRNDVKSLQQDAKLASKLGIAARFEDEVPIVARPGVGFSNQAKFHPLAYIGAISEILTKRGVTICENSEVGEVESNPLIVHCNGIALECEHLIVTTHVPLMGKSGMVSAGLFQTKIAPYSSYVIGAKLPPNLYPEISLWDTSDPYYYLRIDKGKKADYAIFGGQDHKTGQSKKTDSRYSVLEKRLLKLLPEAIVDRRWSGQVIETHDGLPFIGESSPKQFIATGFSGNGYTFGTLAGLMARDYVLNRKSPWTELLSPDRKEVHVGGIWNYFKENLDFPKYFAKDCLTFPEKGTPRSIKKGEGKVLSIEGKRVACSRDANGKIHQVSAVCTHMGCLVRWNNSEKTWDCPCHGSRFQPTGEVLAGPAEKALSKLNLKDTAGEKKGSFN